MKWEDCREVENVHERKSSNLETEIQELNKIAPKENINLILFFLYLKETVHLTLTELAAIGYVIVKIFCHNNNKQ